MKRLSAVLGILFLSLAIAISFVACSNAPADPPEGGWQNPPQDSERPSYEDANILVTYFSVPDNQSNSYVEVNGERLGNTQYMAYVIQENTGANIWRILPVTPYPADHAALLQVAQEERRTNARPEILEPLSQEEMAAYDVIFVGYPNWNSDLPYIMYTFFEMYDFAGKTIIPFNTHGGSGFSGTRETIDRLEPNAAARLDGLSISRNSIEGAEQQIIDWIDSMGLLAGN